jgi:hypothetical protein
MQEGTLFGGVDHPEEINYFADIMVPVPIP